MAIRTKFKNLLVPPSEWTSQDIVVLEITTVLLVIYLLDL